MNAEKFIELLEELKSKNGNTDYYLDLWFNGRQVGTIYADGDLDDIEAEQRCGYLLIYNDSIGVFVDKAEVHSI